MYTLPLLSLLLTAVDWVLLGLTGMNILSGPFDERTCLTDCVRTMFFSGTAAGIGGLLFSFFGLRKPESRMLSYIALAFVLPLLGIFTTLFVIGNMV